MLTSHRARGVEGQREHGRCVFSARFCCVTLSKSLNCSEPVSLSAEERSSPYLTVLLGRLMTKKQWKHLVCSQSSGHGSWLNKCGEAETCCPPRRVGGRSPCPPAHTRAHTHSDPHLSPSAWGASQGALQRSVTLRERHRKQANLCSTPSAAAEPGSHGGG